jgi:hypothetical protein
LRTDDAGATIDLAVGSTLLWSVGEQEWPSFGAAGSTVLRCSCDRANHVVTSKDPDRPAIGIYQRQAVHTRFAHPEAQPVEGTMTPVNYPVDGGGFPASAGLPT